jgi:hypothetical protein
MSNRLLESGDDRLLEDGTSFRLLELLFVPAPGRVVEFCEPGVVQFGGPQVVEFGVGVRVGAM